MSGSRWIVLVVAIAIVGAIVQKGDATGSAWPVIFLALFGIALLGRAIWHMLMLAADTLHPASPLPPNTRRRVRNGSVREKLTWSYLNV